MIYPDFNTNKSHIMNAVVLRMLDIVKDLGYSERKFELSINKSNGYINSMRKRNGSPTVDVLHDIVDKYPQYNINWILTGEGHMRVVDDMVAEHSTPYLKGSNVEQAIVKLIDKVIDEKVTPKFEGVYDSIHRLMKRDMSAIKEDQNNNSKSS